jgi:NAD/NADP transhydrogenase beta subunit
MDLLRDFWNYMKERKKWWLIPTLIVFLLLGLLIVLSSGSALAPFIYSLF